METSTENQVRKVKTSTPVSVDKVYVAEHQKEGTKTAQLRQEVTTKSYYPSKKVNTNLSDNPFETAEFGFAESEFSYTQKRVTWVPVPEASGKDDVEAKLQNDCCIYRIYGNRPIVTEDQLYAIEVGNRTMDQIADKQVLRFGEDHEDAGKLILDKNGKPQYKADFFSNSKKEDIDQRTEVAEDFFASTLIKAELVGVSSIVGQQIN